MSEKELLRRILETAVGFKAGDPVQACLLRLANLWVALESEKPIGGNAKEGA